MRCPEARQGWLAARYASMSPDAEIERHMGECASCRSFTADSQGLDELLALEEAEPPRPGFDTRFFARLEATKSAKPQRRWLRWLVGGVVPAGAAAIAVMLLIGRDPGPSALDLEIAMELDMLQELSLVQHLGEVEALAEVDAAVLDTLLQGGDAPELQEVRP